MENSLLALALPPLLIVPAMGLLSRTRGHDSIGCELRRKALHVCVGLSSLVLPLLLTQTWTILAAFALVAGWFVAVRSMSCLQQRFGRVLHDAGRESWGEMYFAVALAGLLLALCILTRSVISGFVVLLLTWLWYYIPKKRDALKNWGLILLPVAMLTVPWSVRNSLLLGQFALVESSLGFNLYLGYHPDGTGTFDSDIAVDFIEGIGGFDAPGLGTEKLAHNLGMEKGLAFIERDPARAAWLLVSKLSHFLRLDKRAVLFFYSNNLLGELPNSILLLLLLIVCLPWVAVLLLSVVGMCFSDLSTDKALIYLLCLYFIGIHVVIMSEPRFHLVLVPFLTIFAIQGARTLPRAREVIGQPGARWRLALCAAALSLVVLNWVYELNIDMDKLRVMFSPGGNTARFTY